MKDLIFELSFFSHEPHLIKHETTFFNHHYTKRKQKTTFVAINLTNFSDKITAKHNLSSATKIKLPTTMNFRITILTNKSRKAHIFTIPYNSKIANT